MKSYALFQEYIWLVNTIHHAHKITLEEINRKWLETELNEGVTIARSTFNRHKDAIQDMFGIYIECDRKDGFRYYIGNPEVLEEDTIQNWMLSTMSVSSMLEESRSVYDRIILDPIPSSGENLTKIIDAMKKCVRIKVCYRRYGAEHGSTMTLDPYCVKLFGRRWYVLVKLPLSGDLFMLALDRVISVDLTEAKFVYDKEFDPQEHFRECYGIFNDKEVPLQNVIIRAFGKEVFYLRDLPIHHSQKEITTEADYSDFEYVLRPTADFYSPLLARGAAIKVLEPQSVVDAIRDLHEKAFRLYLKENKQQ